MGHESAMCPWLVNSSLALHTNEQHRIVHTYLVNILKSSLMKNQSSIINHPLANFIRGNLGVPFDLNPFVVVGWFCRLGQYSFILSSLRLMSVSLPFCLPFLTRTVAPLAVKSALSCAEVIPNVIWLWFLARAPNADREGITNRWRVSQSLWAVIVCKGSLCIANTLLKSVQSKSNFPLKHGDFYLLCWSQRKGSFKACAH